MKTRFLFTITLAIVLALSASAQSITLTNTIPLYNGATQLRSAWAGGIDDGQFSALELNGDSHMDLVVFDRVDNSISTYVNMGTPNTVDFVYDPSYLDSFPTDLYGWTLFRDYNNDGHMDIFSGSPTSKVRVYRNTKGETGSLGFELLHDRAKTSYPPLLEMYSGKLDIPAIDDIDNDGDLDILTFNILGGRLEWHKNISVDSGWGLDSVQFVLQSSCFGHFDESPVTCTAILADSACFPGQRTNPWDYYSDDPRAHSGSTTTSIDLDGNGLKDVLIGDVGCNTIYALYNYGTLGIADFDSVENNFPSYDVPIDIYIFPATFYLDVDNDGVEDLIAAPNLDLGDVQNTNGCWYYKNTGTSSIPVFDFQYSGFMQNEMIEHGSFSAAGFFDYDNDGLLDMVVGNYAEVQGPLDKRTGIKLYLNTGTTAAPEFTLFDSDFLGLDTLGAFASVGYYQPTFADIDGDGDEDFFFGELSGDIHYFENVAAPGDTADFNYITGTYAGINVGAMSAPHFYDYDGDTDLDLIVGGRKGYMFYYENTGTVLSPTFSSTGDTLGKIKVNDWTGSTTSEGYAKPFFADSDDDGEDELLVGTVEGYIEVYEFTGKAVTDTFDYVANLANHDFGTFATIAVNDLDSNGVLDYFIGNFTGGIQHAVGEFVVSREEIEVPEVAERIKLYPNPAAGIVSIALEENSGLVNRKVSLINMMGQQVYSAAMPGKTLRVDVSNLPAGIYFVNVLAEGTKVTEKLIILD